MSKYRNVARIFIVDELEELCAALADGTVEEQQIAEKFKDLIKSLREYYDRQGRL